MFLIPSALFSFKTLTIQRLTIPSREMPLSVIDYRSESLVYILNGIMVLVSVFQNMYIQSATKDFSNQAKMVFFFAVLVMMIAAIYIVRFNLVFWSYNMNVLFATGLFISYLWKVVYGINALFAD